MKAPAAFRGPFRTDDEARALYAEGAGIFRIIPAAVAIPTDTDDLVALVRWAGHTGTALIPRGAGSGMPGGNVGPGVVVDLTRGFRTGPVLHRESRTAEAGAAVTWKSLNEAAAAHGLRFPVNPSSGRFCTLGGMVATNAAGARSFRYGPMREWVEGIDFVTADGEKGRATRADPERTVSTDAERRLLKDVAPWLVQHQRSLEHAPPATRKNSSGYRLTGNRDDGWIRHLLIGSEGTLAFITGVEVRLAPNPGTPASLMVVLESLAELQDTLHFLERFRAASIELLDRTYLEFVRALGNGLPAATEAVLLVELESESVVKARQAKWTKNVIWATTAEGAERLWELRHRASPILAGLPDHMRSLQVVEDGCVPLNRLSEYIAGLRHVAAGAGFQIVIFGHAGDGHLHANLLADVSAPDLAERLERCLREASALQLALGGTLSGEHGDGRLRAPFLERLYGAKYMEACRMVKAAMDPKGILNPGVKIWGLGSGVGGPGSDTSIVAGSLKVGAGAPPLPAGISELLRDIEREARWDEDRLGLLEAMTTSLQ